MCKYDKKFALRYHVKLNMHKKSIFLYTFDSICRQFDHFDISLRRPRIKLQHWRAFQAENARKSPPDGDFHFLIHGRHGL